MTGQRFRVTGLGFREKSSNGISKMEQAPARKKKKKNPQAQSPERPKKRSKKPDVGTLVIRIGFWGFLIIIVV